MESGIKKPEVTNRTEGRLADGTLVATARKVEAKSRDVAEKLSQAKEQVIEKLSDAKEQVVNKSLGEVVDSGRSVIRENPVNAVLISAGIGALIGFALGRRRS